MKRFFKPFAAAAVALTLLGAGCAPGAADQSSPAAVSESFLKAVQSKDKAAAKALVASDSEFGQNFDEAWEEIGSLTLKSYSVGEVDGNEVKVEMEIEEDGEADTSSETFEVEQKDGKYWIVEP